MLILREHIIQQILTVALLSIVSSLIVKREKSIRGGD
nr:MAG TPA_asm: hypothetical protein [Caudoviricetes sp.]